MRESKVPVGLDTALREAGIDGAAVLAAARLPSRVFETPGQKLSVREYFALWSAIRAVSARPDLGIELARAVKPDHTEPLFLAILSAPDVGGALEVLAAYKRILSPEDLELRKNDAIGEVALLYAWPEGEAPPVLVDVELAFIVEMCRRGTRTPALSPRALHLVRPTLDEGTTHAEYFRCPIHLGAPANALVFSLEDCALRFSTHNPQLSSVLVPYMQANTPPRSPLARVRAVIAERLSGRRPSLTSVGKELAMSTRALQRLLKDNGTTFRALLDDVRNERALSYLRATKFSDGEVAFLLGFEDPNSFYRAFRAWNGMSPSEFRRRPDA
jgi:AraC-like DNA-binding protein